MKLFLSMLSLLLGFGCGSNSQGTSATPASPVLQNGSSGGLGDSQGDSTTIVADQESGGNASCQPKALASLKKLNPQGYSVYLQNKDFFSTTAWWQCDDFVADLDTAVHETIHALTSEHNAYPLIDGTLIAPAPETKVFFPPSEISDQIDASMDHSFYILEKNQEDEPSSVKEFRYLLDELNAYTHGLDTTNHLLSAKTGTDDSRDGAVALMYFVDRYVDRAQKKHPETWAAMNANQTRATIQKLWSQAETVTTEACRLNTPGLQDQWYEQRLCSSQGHEAMRAILGRDPVCPKHCLDLEQSSQNSKARDRSGSF